MFERDRYFKIEQTGSISMEITAQSFYPKCIY